VPLKILEGHGKKGVPEGKTRNQLKMKTESRARDFSGEKTNRRGVEGASHGVDKTVLVNGEGKERIRGLAALRSNEPPAMGKEGGKEL